MDLDNASMRCMADRVLAASIRDGVSEQEGAPRAPLGRLARQVAAQQVSSAISPIVITGLIRLADLTVIAALGLAMYFGFAGGGTVFLNPVLMILLLIVPLVSVVSFQAMQLYTVPALRSTARQCARIVVAWNIVFALIFALLFMTNFSDSVSRIWMVTWYCSGLLGLMAVRVVIANIVNKWVQQGRLVRRAVVVGGGQNGEELIEAITANPDNDIHICGVFDDRGDDRSPASVAGYPKLGNIGQLIEFARLTRVDILIVSLPVSAEKRVLELFRKLWVLPVDIRLSAHGSQLLFRPRSYSYIGDTPFIDMFDRPITDWDLVLKHLFDRVVGGLILLAALPVMLLVALAVKIDSPGPVLFKQRRFGFNNELVEIYKFRSMYVEQADSRAEKLVTKGDPRVTRVGRWIRKTSLDELPQLLNVVLKGDLSLVGPRPHATQAKAADKLYDEIVDGYFARHRVKPGITGWAQVNGWRGETDTIEKLQKRVEHDLYYIENWSIWLDCKILALTPLSLLADRDQAY